MKAFQRAFSRRYYDYEPRVFGKRALFVACIGFTASKVSTKANLCSAKKRTPVAVQPPFLQRKQRRRRLGGQVASLKALPTSTALQRDEQARNVANSPRRPPNHSVSASAQCGRRSCSTLNTTCHIGAEETVQAWQSWQLRVTASPFESVRARHVELVVYPSTSRPRRLHAPPDHAQLLRCPSAVTPGRLSDQMIESALSICHTHSGRIDL